MTMIAWVGHREKAFLSTGRDKARSGLAAGAAEVR